MNFYNSMARYLMAPTLDLFRGTKAIKCLRELEESQWWPREKILELQNQRLQHLIKQACVNVPYYRHVFYERGLKPEDIKTVDDLVKLPIITRKIVRDNFAEMIASDFPVKERVKLATGGSTGEPLTFYSTRHDHLAVGFAARERTYPSFIPRLGYVLSRAANPTAR